MPGFATKFWFLAAASVPLLAACTPVKHLQSVATTGSALFGAAGAPVTPVSLGPTELRQLQSREFLTSKATAYASVMTVLLDSGYRVLSADLAAGLITAAAPTNSRLRLDTTGIAKSNQTPLASVFIDQRTASTVHIRVNFSVSTVASGQLGEQGESSVLDQALYSAFFARIGQEVIERTNLAASPPAVQEVAEPVPDTDPSQDQAIDRLANQGGTVTEFTP